MGFHGASVAKTLPANVGDEGSIPRLGRSPGAGNGNPLQYSCWENSHGKRSLVCCSPWGHKEQNTTEWLTTHTHKTLLHSTENSTQYFVMAYMGKHSKRVDVCISDSLCCIPESINNKALYIKSSPIKFLIV